jgi:hypothetical protein
MIFILRFRVLEFHYEAGEIGDRAAGTTEREAAFEERHARVDLSGLFELGPSVETPHSAWSTANGAERHNERELIEGLSREVFESKDRHVDASDFDELDARAGDRQVGQSEIGPVLVDELFDFARPGLKAFERQRGVTARGFAQKMGREDFEGRDASGGAGRRGAAFERRSDERRLVDKLLRETHELATLGAEFEVAATGAKELNVELLL